MMKIYCNVCNKYRQPKNRKISYIFKKTLGIYIVCSKCDNDYKKIFNKEEPIEILKMFGLVTNMEEYEKLHNHENE